MTKEITQASPLESYLFMIHETTPSIPKGYAAYERQETSCRLSAGELPQKRSSILGGALCARPGVRAPLTKEKETRKENQLSLAPRGRPLHRLPCHPLIHSGGIGTSSSVPSATTLPIPDSSKNLTNCRSHRSGDGGRGHSHVLSIGPLEPGDDLFYRSQLRVGGGLLAADVACALCNRRAFTFVVIRDYPTQTCSPPERSIRPGVA
jgi:hypothetical protein